MFVCLALSVYHKVNSPLSDYVYVCVVLNMSTDVLLKFVSGVKLCPLSIWRCKSKWKQRTRIEHKTSPAVTAGDAEREIKRARERERERKTVWSKAHTHITPCTVIRTQLWEQQQHSCLSLPVCVCVCICDYSRSICLRTFCFNSNT